MQAIQRFSKSSSAYSNNVNHAQLLRTLCRVMAYHLPHLMSSKNILPKYQSRMQFPAVQKQPRCFKLILNGADRMPGSSLTEAQFRITLPDQFLADRLNLTVEACLHCTAPNENCALEQYPYSIALQGLMNPYSYVSNVTGPSGVIAVAQTRTFVNSAQKDLGGATLVDRRFFEQPITVRLDSRYCDITAAVTIPWTLVLNLWDAGA
ncbi:TPA_asm: hypothetical protein [Coelastrella green algae MELD virus]|nr:TPA_asm: hypothetical protein [Coelastrella green algae MELD virus]